PGRRAQPAARKCGTGLSLCDFAFFYPENGTIIADRASGAVGKTVNNGFVFNRARTPSLPNTVVMRTTDTFPDRRSITKAYSSSGVSKTSPGFSPTCTDAAK